MTAPAGIPRTTEPIMIPSPFPPKPPKPKSKTWRWAALGAAVLSVGAEVARIWYPSLYGPLQVVQTVIQATQ
jgi:hypothetical protein